jgi:uncharacterized membrane protein
LIPLLLGLALAVPLVAAIWFAPALVVFHNLSALDAMRASLRGCLRNIVPFLLYGVLALVLAIVATVPALLGWLVLLPLIVTSLYVGYRDIFTDMPVQPPR